jgi:hypothetical protein
MMTLIITVEAKNHIVATADGRSKGKISSNTLQKIFPHPNRGFAIAHHGQNLIGNRRVQDIANEFLVANTGMIGKSSVQHIARLFVQQHGQSIKKTLTSISGRDGCGLLFFGFAITTKKPKLYEAWWPPQQPNSVTYKKHNDLALSGEAKDFIEGYIDDPKEKEFRRKRILKATVQEAKAYCDKLYKFAEDAQTKADEYIFGGHKHQLVIKKSGCKWLIPPKQGSPTAAGQSSNLNTY